MTARTCVCVCVRETHRRLLSSNSRLLEALVTHAHRKGISMYVIYALVDPRDNTVRYVGMSADVYKRFVEHINNSGANYAKNSWIMELRALNKMVIMISLEEVAEYEYARERERYWIQHFEVLGSPVMNIMGTVSARNARKKSEQIARRIERDFIKIEQEKVQKPVPVSYPAVPRPPAISDDLISNAVIAWNNGNRSTRRLARALSQEGNSISKDKALRIIREMHAKKLIEM
jgi:predicted GIY-YIG superfamily endonuclease